MHQVEAVTGQSGAGAEAAGVVGAPEGGGVGEAEEQLQRAKVGCYSQCSLLPICNFTHSWAMYTLLPRDAVFAAHRTAYFLQTSNTCLNIGMRACPKVQEMHIGLSTLSCWTTVPSSSAS